MEQVVYHVLLEGRSVGPYDGRTIVGMRIKKALTSEDLLVGSDGTRLTVGDLIQGRSAPFRPGRTGGFSVVQATYPANLLAVEGAGIDIPRFKGEVEARVQGDVLRLAGRFRHHLRWKEGRVKIVLKDVVHAAVKGTQADLWLRTGRPGLQRISLEMFAHEAAGELVNWLPAATALPPSSAAAPAGIRARAPHALWIPLLGVAVVAVVVLLLVFLAAY